jgi:heme A synthase
MSLISLLVTLLVLGLIVWFIFWLIEQIPLPATPKMIIKVVVGLIVVLYLLGMLTGGVAVPVFRY